VGLLAALTATEQPSNHTTLRRASYHLCKSETDAPLDSSSDQRDSAALICGISMSDTSFGITYGRRTRLCVDVSGIYLDVCRITVLVPGGRRSWPWPRPSPAWAKAFPATYGTARPGRALAIGGGILLLLVFPESRFLVMVQVLIGGVQLIERAADVGIFPLPSGLVLPFRAQSAHFSGMLGALSLAFLV
jgi:hypothetical protein